MALEAGYDPAVVFDWLDRHASKTDRGRYTTLCGRVLEDTHRDTFDRWREWRVTVPDWRAPLGRFDEILMFYGLALREFELWAEEHHGWDAFLPSTS